MGNPDQHSPSSLKQWVRGDADSAQWNAGSIADGDGVQTWQNEASSGATFSLTQGTAGARPTYKAGIINGKPAVLFDGVDDFMQASSAILSSLIANNAFTFLAVIQALEGSNQASIYSNDAVFADSGGFVGLHIKQGLNAHIYNFDGTADETSVAFDASRPVVLIARHDSGTIYISKNNGSEASVASGNTSTLTGNLLYGKSFDGVQFGKFYLCEWAAWNASLSSADRAALYDTMRLKWLGGLPNQINQARAVASQVLRLRSRAPSRITWRVPTAIAADVAPGDDVAYTHPALAGARSGIARYQRGFGRVMRKSLKPGDAQATLVIRDNRPYICTYWDIGISKKSAGALADGIARLDVGNTRTFTRASPAWVRDPGDGRLVLATYDTEKHDRNGDLFEGSSSNEQIEGGFKNGATDVFTGWTKTGTGSNGSNITEDRTNLLWDSSVVPRVVKFLAGTPIHAADMYLQGTATAASASISRVSFGHLDTSGQALSYAIQRASDSKWWRDSDQTWQASLTWNAMTVSSSEWHIHVTKQLDPGSSTTLTVRVGIPTTGTAGQVNYLGLVQIERQKFPSSAILTETAGVTRAVDRLLVSNNSSGRCWHNTRGTGKATVKPEWDAADVTAQNKTVVYVGHDANNYEWVYFDGANARWVFERRVAGTIYRAVKGASPVRGTAYALGWRWTSSEGELGLTNFTASIFVDGVKGTDVATTAAPTEVATVNMEVGSKAAAEHFDGNIYYFELIQLPFTDAEMARV